LFVEIPQTGARYAVVAAGVLGPAGRNQAVFNKLQIVGIGPAAAQGLGTGEMRLLYSGYRQPPTPSDFQLIVKVLVFDSDVTNLPVVSSFVRFDPDPDGFVLKLTEANGADLKPEILRRTSLMVEVSEYGRLVSIP
jgi:hypothetical protein